MKLEANLTFHQRRCHVVLQILTFLMEYVQHPYLKDYTIALPADVAMRCVGLITFNQVQLSVVPCGGAMQMTKFSGPAIVFLACNLEMNIQLVKHLPDFTLKNSRILVLVEDFNEASAWSDVLALSKTEVNFVKPEENEIFSVYRVFRHKNQTLLANLPKPVRWGEDQTGDLAGVDFFVTVVKADFYKFDADVIIKPDGKVELAPCFVADLVKILGFSLNLTVILKASDHWGKYDEKNSKWVGMVGDLVNGETDFALSSILHNNPRREVIDYNLEMYTWKFLALYREPDFRRDSLAFVKPFSGYAWLTIFFYVTFLALALMGVHIVYMILSREHDVDSYESEGLLSLIFTADNKETLVNCLFWPLSWLCTKGIRRIPSEVPLQLVSLSGLIFGFVTHTFYAGQLISFLAVSIPPFSNLDQLLSTSYDLDAMSGDPFIMLQLATSPAVQQAVQRIQEPLSHVSVGGARKDILKGSYIFLAYDVSAYWDFKNFYSGVESCSIGQVELPVDGPKLGTAMTKGTPFKRSFDYVILKCKQFGLDERWIKAFLPHRPVCIAPKSEEGIPLKSVIAPIALYALCIGIALAILVGERVSHSSKVAENTHNGLLSSPQSRVSHSASQLFQSNYSQWHNEVMSLQPIIN